MVGLPGPRLDLTSGNRSRTDVRILDKTGDEKCRGGKHGRGNHQQAEVIIASGRTVKGEYHADSGSGQGGRRTVSGATYASSGGWEAAFSRLCLRR